jgi:Raf kinase inhibitor-like YbhB/YbcL family protein
MTGQIPSTIPGFVISSTAFVPGGTIPRKFTGEGADVSPAFAWTGVPPGTRELALVCDDPDAPGNEPWVHWVLYGLSPSLTALQEAVPRDPQPANPQGAGQGLNSWPKDNVGYRGPMPPPGHGVHHYHFKFYALDVPLKLAPRANKNTLLAAMKGHVIGATEVVGTYERKGM